MYLKKTISDNSGNTIVDAEHIIKELNISGGMLSFLLQSFAPPSGDEERLPFWICPYISRHLLSLNPLLARCRRYSRGER